MHGFKAKLVATEGLLLGGVRQHISSSFESRENALDWVKASIEANLEAKRKVKFIGFLEVNFVEIYDEQLLNNQERSI